MTIDLTSMDLSELQKLRRDVSKRITTREAARRHYEKRKAARMARKLITQHKLQITEVFPEHTL